MRHLELYDKFYMTDIGIRHGLVGYRDNDIAGLLENVVYLELLARGYTVSVGKFRDYEIDFVAERQTERLYVQVCYSLANEDTVDRSTGHSGGCPTTIPSWCCRSTPHSQPTATVSDGRISSTSYSTRQHRDSVRRKTMKVEARGRCAGTHFSGKATAG